MKLYTHQKLFLQRKDNNRILLVWGCGSGKTITALMWSKIKVTIKGGRVLYIVPKHLKTRWIYDINKYGINGMVITKEELRRDWNVLEKFDGVVIDECHYFSNVSSAMTKALLKYLKKWNMQYVLGLTGTPYLSTPFNIYALGLMVGKGNDKRWGYMSFKRDYFIDIKFGNKRIPKIKKGIEQSIADRVAEISDVVKLEDCVDIPKAIEEVEYFSLNKAQKKAIDNIDAINHISYWTQFHQLCGGTLKGNAYRDTVYIDNDKLQRVVELAQQNKKIIIVCKYTEEANMIEKYIKETGKKTVVLNGDTKEDKHTVTTEANSYDDCALIVSAQVSEGWEAKTFNIMVFYSYDFSLKNYQQIISRIQRIDAIQKCTYISLLMKDTIDEDAYESVVIKKMDFHLKIYNTDRKVV